MLKIENLPFEIINICQLLTNQGFQAFIVGGSIRDIIQGAFIPQDWDIATDAKPSEVIKIFNKRFRVIPTGIKHGTVTILYNDLGIEVTTFRKEGDYIDGRRPSEVYFVGNIVNDLSRRDLTINAIAYDPINDELLDPFHGIDDIKAQVIRMVGDPNERLQEDGLRLIRIFRFVSQLGFDIEAKTLSAIPFHFEIFTKVAKERILTEFQKLLQGAFFQKAIQLLEESGLLFHIIPEFSHDEFQKVIPELKLNRIKLTLIIISELSRDSSLRLRFATLIHQLPIILKTSKKPFPPFQEKIIQEFMKRMKCSNKLITDVTHILSIHLLPLPYSITEKAEEKNYSIRKFQYTIRPEYLHDYLLFYEAKEIALKKIQLKEELKADILKRAETHPPIDLNTLVINGDDVIEYLQLNKKYASQREFIGYCLDIIRERVEIDPQINQKRFLLPILDSLNRILSQCTTRITRGVRVVSTDHIRKLYRNGSPEYIRWENEHTYLLAKWLALCLLRKDQNSIVIFDGTNFNMPTHPNHRELLGNKFRKYRPLYINTNATEDEVKLNLQARDHEKSTFKKSDADFSIFQRYQELLRTYPKALSTPKECDLIRVSTRHPKFETKIQDIVNLIRQNRHRFIIMSGNVLTGKTYTAYILQKQLEYPKDLKI
ncbi:MAG: CCA tRNA nucleotidyltransferase [Candidatus Hodarchaeota archaeon]